MRTEHAKIDISEIKSSRYFFTATSILPKICVLYKTNCAGSTEKFRGGGVIGLEKWKTL